MKKVVLTKIKIAVYNSKQSVHIPSIVDSSVESLRFILTYKPSSYFIDNEEEIISHILKRYDVYKRNQLNIPMQTTTYYEFPICQCFPFFNFNRSIKPTFIYPILPVIKWCNDLETLHSIYEVPYKLILFQVWKIIQDYEHVTELENILFEELENSVDMCFSGRVLRTINTLSGFVPDIFIGISEKEQMQNQIVCIVKKIQRTSMTMEEGIEQIDRILKSFEVNDIEHAEWMKNVDEQLQL